MKVLSLEEVNRLSAQPITDRTAQGRINQRLLHTAREYHRTMDALKSANFTIHRALCVSGKEHHEACTAHFEAFEALKESEGE